MNKFSACLIGCLLMATLAYGQRHLQEDAAETHYRSGLELLDKSLYGPARTAFEQYINAGTNDAKVADAKYYAAFCAIGLFNNDGEKRMSEFIAQHPVHPKSKRAYYELGTFYYRNKNYSKAISYMSKANLNELPAADQQTAYFNLGYAHFSKKQFANAARYFNKVKGQNSQYQPAANYYSGYIA